MESTYDKIYKIILVSWTASGKSSLIKRFDDGSFDPNQKYTIGAEFASKIIEEDGKKIKLQIWDIASQETFRAIKKAYYSRTKGVVIVYDITNQDSFNFLDEKIKEVCVESPGACIVICGNKSDLKTERIITVEQGMKLAESQGAAFIETSAKNFYNINDLFLILARMIIEKEKC